MRHTDGICCLQDGTVGDAVFDMARNTRLRGGHAGAVTRLSLTDQLLCSSSLDFTARLWKRGPSLRCVSVLHFGDWVWDIVARCARPSHGSYCLLTDAARWECVWYHLIWYESFGCMCRGRHVLAAAGQSVRVHDVDTAAALRSYTATASRDTLAPLRVEGTRDDRLVFSGAATSNAIHDLTFLCPLPA